MIPAQLYFTVIFILVLTSETRSVSGDNDSTYKIKDFSYDTDSNDNKASFLRRRTQTSHAAPISSLPSASSFSFSHRFLDEVDEQCPCVKVPEWKNHGQFVKCISDRANRLITDGRLTTEEAAFALAKAQETDCGISRIPGGDAPAAAAATTTAMISETGPDAKEETLDDAAEEDEEEEDDEFEEEEEEIKKLAEKASECKESMDDHLEIMLNYQYLHETTDSRDSRYEKLMLDARTKAFSNKGCIDESLKRAMKIRDSVDSKKREKRRGADEKRPQKPAHHHRR